MAWIELDGDIELGIGLVVAFSTVLLMGIAACAIAWGGRRAGMLIGLLGVAVGLFGLGCLLLAVPQLWWISVFPVGIGAAAVRAWYRHTGPATARRLRFDLRGLLALILFLGLVLGGITSQYRQMLIEEDAAAKLESLPGGRGSNWVEWRFGRVNRAFFLVPPDPADFEQAADALGQFSQLHGLQINGAKLSGRITQRIGRLIKLHSLCLQHTPLTDEDLLPLASLQDLEYLELEASQITDAGLAHLRGLERLRVLNLYTANQITPSAMANLRAGLPRLDNR